MFLFPYDYLILATGATHSYFGHNEFEEFAPGHEEPGRCSVLLETKSCRRLNRPRQKKTRTGAANC